MGNRRSAPKQGITWTTIAILALLAAFYLYDAINNPSGESQPTQAPAYPVETSGPVAAAGTEEPAMLIDEPTAVATSPRNKPVSFDYYVLSLSWSPNYCATNGSDDEQQCSLGKKLGFVLHGLWPQYNKGYPSNCSTEKLPSAVKKEYANLYPSSTLMVHEWEKHGTCSELEPREYLQLSKNIKESVIIPTAYNSPEKPLRVTVQQLKDDFVAANPGLDASGLAVICSDSGRYLSELRVCFSTDGVSTSCGADVQKDATRSCGNKNFLVRNVR